MINNLLWNIRGIGNIKSRRRVVKLVKMYNISLISILEPLHHANKIQEFSNRMGFHFSLANQEADDKRWICWNHEVNVVLVDAFEQCITVDTSFLNSDLVRLTFLYAKCSIQFFGKNFHYCPKTYKVHGGLRVIFTPFQMCLKNLVADLQILYLCRNSMQ